MIRSSHACAVFGASLAILVAPLLAQTPESRAADTRPSPDRITFALLEPPAESRPAESRAAQPVAIIRITNGNQVPVTLWPFVSLEIRDARGEVQKPSSNRGRWGRRKQACFLEAVNFAVVKPGESLERKVNLDTYTHDPNAILGWKLKPGDYTLTARTTFARAEFVARCKLGCESHADPRRDWNTALELSREAARKISVK